jgi:two-component sensor histidine kinase
VQLAIASPVRTAEDIERAHDRGLALWREALMRDTSVDNPPAGVGADDFPIVITTLPANARQHKIAFRGFAFSMVVVALVTFANIPLSPIDAFVPLIEVVICLAALLTAAFLFAQYSLQPRIALLALASGFVFSGLFAFLHTLAYPGAYTPGVLIGDELSSAAWLFFCWHTTFPISVIVYALTKGGGEAANGSGRSTRVAIGISVACVAAVTAGLTWGATAGAAYLPSLHKNVLEQTTFSREDQVFLLILNTVAIVLLFLRRRTILDQWLIVTLFAWLPNFVGAMLFVVNRFTLGWYMARVYGLLAGSSLLFVLLMETLLLYTRLANAVALLRRSEQHQRLLIAELDHRVKNVLAQVDGVVASTGEGSRSINDFIRSLRGRIQSMAAAHALLSESSWQSVALDNLVLTELAPYATDTNVKITGTDILLTSAETQALAKVLHELATNATKYGALLVPGGQVSISWDREPNGPAATLILEWRESGGPPAASKVQSSYGTDLIRNLIPHELGGWVDLAFVKQGVNCRIEIPLKQAATVERW